jgi:endonuclease/exonuclease/phosphatase family metal-dependent hydrolase
MRRLSGLMLCLALLGCPEPIDVPDSGGLDAGPTDAGFDAGADAGTEDAGPRDAGTEDGGFDGGPEDSGFDAGPFDAGPDLRCPPRDGGVPDGGLLRVVAANLTSGNLQSWNPGEGKRILQGLKPDVALMQEFNIGANTDVDRRAFVDSTFGEEFCFYVEPGGGIPNGVVTRWPILDAGRWVDPEVSNRGFAWTQIDVPGARDLWAISVHLLTSGSGRPAEAVALVGNINQFIPVGDLLVIGGDFNTGNRNETAIQTLSQVVRTAGPHPADQSGNDDTNAGRSSPYDWVIPDADLYALQVPVVIGAASFDAGLVFDSRVFTPLSAVPPILAGDSAAPAMQHMAVVKDFLLP